MSVSEADLAALAVHICAMISEQLGKAICLPTAESVAQAALDRICVHTIALAQANGARIDANGKRIEKLEHTIARSNAAEAHRATAQALLNDPKFAIVVERAYEQMISHASTTFQKNVSGWLGKPFLNNREASKVLGITPQALSNMRKRKEGPRWSGSGKWVRYERHEIERWLRELPTTDS